MSEPHVEDVPPEVREVVLSDMQHWLERAVIGLNLCPFAKSVHIKGQIHWRVSAACDDEAVRCELARELRSLQESDPEQHDTTLLVLPLHFRDFLDFNAFLAQADGILAELGLLGELQLASFHPQYQFAGTDADDITNFTNRAPYPTLHLLREASIDRAVEAFPQAEAIFERNMRVLEQMGHAGWDALEISRRVEGDRHDDASGDKT